MLLFSGPLSWAAHGLDVLFTGHPDELLWFVVIICPMLLNIAQAWIQDAHLLWSASAEPQAQRGQGWQSGYVPMSPSAPSAAPEAGGIEMMRSGASAHSRANSAAPAIGDQLVKRASSNNVANVLERQSSCMC
jgi:STIMATE family